MTLAQQPDRDTPCRERCQKSDLSHRRQSTTLDAGRERERQTTRTRVHVAKSQSSNATPHIPRTIAILNRSYLAIL